ncbi:MAG: hypothetical protein JWQ27_200 [Ferruginibacter sp.]|nr:hypothetical protein [Ferruginibacter sp.]
MRLRLLIPSENRLFPKKFLLFISIIFVAFSTNAQVANYSYNGTPGTFTALTSPTNVFGTTSWDDNIQTVNIGFTFWINGKTYTTCSVNSNGFITFGATTSLSNAVNPISDNTGYEAAVSVFGRDLINNGTTQPGYKTTGTAGSKIFTVEWMDARRKNSGSAVSGDVLDFQIRLHETTGKIEIIYGPSTVTNLTDYPGQVGLRGLNNSDYHNRTITGLNTWASTTQGGNNNLTCKMTNLAKPATNTMFTYLPPPCVAPANQPTSLVLTPTATTISGTFTAASPAVSGYLVVRTTTGAAAPTPVDGTVYTAGTNTLGDLVEYVGSSTSFTTSFLAPSTAYKLWVFAYNNTNCLPGPSYKAASPLNNTATTLGCGASNNLYWAGYASTMAGGTSGTDFNDPLNWSTSSSSYVNAGVVGPNACSNISLDITLSATKTSSILTFSDIETYIKDFTVNLKTAAGTSGGVKSLQFLISNRVTVYGNSTFFVQSNGSATVQTEVNLGANSVMTYVGNVTTSHSNTSTGKGFNYPFSVKLPADNLGTLIIKGNCTLSGIGDDGHPNSKPNLVIFDGTGTQTITNNNVTDLTNYDSIYLGHTLQIGNLNTPTVVFNGTGDQGFTVLHNITINPGATLDIASGQVCNKMWSVAGAANFTMGANSKLILRGSGGGVGNSNFPKNFTTYSIDPTSTIEYAGAAQDIFNGFSYGHISIKNAGIKTAPSGTMIVRGDFTQSAGAGFAHNNGTVNFTGTVAQTFSSASIVPFYNFINNNSNATGLTVTGSLSVAKELNLAGTSKLNLVSDITLISDATNTANVAQISGATINYTTGKFIVERFIATPRRWQLVSVPANTTQTIKQAWQENQNPGVIGTAGLGTNITGPATGIGFDFTSPGYSMKYWNSATNAFVNVNNTTVAFPQKDRGYFLFVRGDRSATAAAGTPTTTVIRTSGQINTGNYPVINVPAGNFFSIGNPYPSSIDFDLITKTNVKNIFYLWDPKIGGAYGVGAYQTFNKILGYKPLISGGSYSTSVGSSIIQSGQAFYVDNTAMGAGTVSFKEADKSNSSTMVFREGNNGSNAAGVRQLIKGFLYTSGVAIDGNALVYDSEFAAEAADYNANKMANVGESFSIKKDNKIFSVNALTNEINTDTIFYNMGGLGYKTYQLKFVTEDINPNLIGWVSDKYLNILTPLKYNDTTYVDFTVTGDAGTWAADRFKIIFKPMTVLPVTISSISANRNSDKTISVNWKVENELNMKQYDLERSADGRNFTKLVQAMPQAPNGGSAAYNKIDVAPLAADNFYRVKAISLNGLVQYSSIVKVGSTKTTASIGVYPNPVEGNIMNVQFSNQANGAYQLQLTNKAGQLVYKGTVQVSNSNDVQSVNLGNGTSKGIYQLTITSANGTTSTQQVFIK